MGGGCKGQAEIGSGALSIQVMVAKNKGVLDLLPHQLCIGFKTEVSGKCGCQQSCREIKHCEPDAFIQTS